ncbi:MAG: hypothetical protein O9326_01055 [Microcystis sp. LE19-338.1B]|jgi:hypothetical protein|nr:hypothetical protein [Microcystis sp. LE19-338.1B]MCZ8360234.1 hypothetical protein [Microcystis sp. LE19-388.1G]
MTQWELKAIGSLTEIKALLDNEQEKFVKDLHAQTDEQFSNDTAQAKACKANQHTCEPTMKIVAMNKSFDLRLTGTGDSTILGNPFGPRALVWEKTELSGFHPDLGNIKVSLEPNQVHAGTLIPLKSTFPLPAINRNNYFFVIEIENVGELISEEPAIVEALIKELPPKATYQFLNPPLNFYLRSDPDKKVVAILEKASRVSAS